MNGQRGFTIVELLVAMLVGTITILAAFQALDSYVRTDRTVTVRSDSTQRARMAMDGLIRALRSQACPGPDDPALLAGGADWVSFATDLSDGTVAPERRVVTFDPVARKLTEARYAGNRNPTTGLLTFAASPTSWGSGVTDVETSAPAAPVFGYWGYDTSTPPRPTVAMPTPLSTADRGRVARITVSFRVSPPPGDRDRAAGATLSDEIMLRSVDPADPVPLPLCS